jgi:formylglycine-generating enzyme required for sulfatase activity
MLFQDDVGASPKPKMSRGVNSGMNGALPMARPDTHGTKTPEVFEERRMPFESGRRPFHQRPLFSNRRAWPYQKGVVGAGFLIAAAFGYLLGFHRTKNTAPPSLRSETLPSSTATIPEGQLVALQGGECFIGDTIDGLTENTALPSLPVETPPSSPAKIPEAEFVALQGGEYLMGDTIDGMTDAQPHRVSLSPFIIGRCEVTLELWDSVRLWGQQRGYEDLPAASGKAHDHPVYGISWGDAVKWCNALSEKEGLTPCYYTDTTTQNVVRDGMADIANQQVDWQANGYRLPTEAEWEFAARGGLEGTRFPSGNEVTQEHANYHGSGAIEYDKSRRAGTAAALRSTLPYTAAAGSFLPNQFGLYDMAGNVAEWCWDFYDPNYGSPPQLLNDPHGPQKGKNCVVRGGSWRHTAAYARCASRLTLPGDLPAPFVGFRLVRGL